MDLTAAVDFLHMNHRAVLATSRAAGSAQLSPVVAGVDAEGNAVISTRETAMKVGNIRRNPTVSLCVMNDGFFGRWIQIDGTADVVELPGAMGGLEDLYRQVAGEHPNWDEFRDAMRAERRVLLRITIANAGPDRTG